jgi:4-amino-4-deoxychorismate lyase
MLIDGLPCDSIPASDRGLAYGDGLFETIRVHQGRALFLPWHLQRLAAGCERLGIASALPQWQDWIAQALQDAPAEGVLKLLVTRGSGGRGYRAPEPASPRCIVSLHALPAVTQPDPAAGCSAFVCQQRLALQPALAGLKHLNRLEQVLASREFPDASWHEGLMLDTDGRLVEGTRSNVFVVVQGELLTPQLTRCGVAGVMRGRLLELFAGRVREQDLPASVLDAAEEIFVCNSVLGIWPVARLRHGAAERQLQPGRFAREAQAWLAGVLAA